MSFEIPGKSDHLTSPELKDRGLTLYNSWSGTLANDLVHASRQAHILDSTPNDAARRFSDWEAAMDWFDEGERSVYSLRDEQNQLAGVIWYDVRERADIGATHTFAIRLYEQAVGKGLGLPFMKAAHEDFAAHANNPVVWLETESTNEPALRLYMKFGYRVMREHNGRVTMVYDKNQQVQ